AIGGAWRGMDLLGLEGGADLDRTRRKPRPRNHLLQCGAQSVEGRRLERQLRKLERSAGKYFPRWRRCRGRLCPGRQSREARPDAGRGLRAAALNSDFRAPPKLSSSDLIGRSSTPGSQRYYISPPRRTWSPAFAED